jgi:hypothetical protein
MYEQDTTKPVNPFTGKHPMKFIGLWNLDVAIMEYNEKKGCKWHSEDYSYVFKDGSTFDVVIETHEKVIPFRNKDWEESGDSDITKYYDGRVMTKSFIIDGLGVEGDDKTFRSIASAKRFVNEDLQKFEERYEKKS